MLTSALMATAAIFPANAADTKPVNGTDFYVDGLKYDLIVENGVITGAAVQQDFNNDYNYCKLSGELDIPSYVTYGDTQVPVVSIYNSAFYRNKTITKITVPSTVTVLGNSVFKEAVALKEVDLSASNIDKLYSNLFEGCTELMRVNFPASATSWNTTSAFKGCAKLKSVTFPDNSKLTTVSGGTYSSAEASNTGAFNGCAALKSFRFPASVEVVSASSMFYNCGVTTVTFTDNRNTVDMTQKYPGLRLTGTHLFSDCASLRTVIFPTVMNYLGTASSTVAYNYVFYNCPELTSVVFPEGSTINTVGHYFMWNCGITSIELPESVTTLGTYAFANCKSLKNFKYPPLLTTVPDYCFYNCASLESVELHEGIKTVGSRVFEGCTSLKSMVFPEGITSIGSSSQTFYGCSSLEYVVLPSTLTTCGYLVNNACTSIKAVIARAETPSTLSTSSSNNNWWSKVTVYVPSEDALNKYKAKSGWKNLTNYQVAGELSMPATATLYLNETATLSNIAKVNNVDSSIPELQILWKSSNPEVASVDAGGFITAKALTADTPVTISANYWGVKMDCALTIVNNPFLITPKDVAMGLGATVAPVISLAYNQYGSGMGELPADPTYLLVSDDPEVVEVTEGGNLKGLKYGEANISATYRGETKSFKAYVQPDGEFGIDPQYEVKTGESISLAPWIELDGTKMPVDPAFVKWSTTDTGSKTLFIDSEGMAYGIDNPKTVIVTANYYGKEAVCMVKVVANDNPALPQVRDHNLTVHMPDALGRVTLTNAPASTLVEFVEDETHELSTARHNGKDITGELNNHRYTVNKNSENNNVITAEFDKK